MNAKDQIEWLFADLKHLIYDAFVDDIVNSPQDVANMWLTCRALGLGFHTHLNQIFRCSLYSPGDEQAEALADNELEAARLRNFII